MHRSHREGPAERRIRLALLFFGALGCSAGTGERPPTAEHGLATRPQPRPIAPELRPVLRALEEQRFGACRALAQEHLAAHPQDPQALYLLGMSHYLTGNYGAARPWLVQTLEADPELEVAREPLAYSLLLLGELGGARREYEAYVAAVPGDPKGHYGLGLIELEEARLDVAAERFRRAIELFDELGRSDARQAATRQAEFAECHARLGEVHFARGEYQAARAELLRATEIAPGNISAFYTLSLVHRRLGEEALAVQAVGRYESARQALLAQQRAGQE